MTYASRDRGEIKVDKIKHGVEVNSSLDAATEMNGEDSSENEGLVNETIQSRVCRVFQNVISSVNSGFTSRMALLRVCWISVCHGSNT